jgi:WD40 repeat protein
MLFKTDSTGNLLWQKQNTFKLRNLLQTQDSTFLIFTNNYSSVIRFYVMRLNKFGEIMSEKAFNTQKNDQVDNVCLTDDNGFMVIGESYDGQRRVALLKSDINGKQIWYKYFNGYTGNIIQIAKGNYLLIIKRLNNSGIDLIKIDGTGNILWTRQFVTDKNMLSYDALAIKNEEFVITGGIGNNGISTTYFLKVDSLGEKICEYIGDSPNSCYYSISSIADTLFAATGNFNNQIGVDIINNQGELVNSVRFPERNGVINSIVTTKDNDLFLTGSITPPYKLTNSTLFY